MPLPQKPPGRGAANRRVHFPFATTPRGGSWEAYIAGPCHWYDCHTIGRSKPCLCEMTDGELVCDRDHDLDEPRTLGYQPLYAASNGRPCFVIVYDYAREQIDKLRLHFLVQVSREKGKSETVAIVHHKLTAPLYHSTRADLMRPADLTESLLRIWKIPELVAWYRCTQGKGDNTMSLSEPAFTPPAKKPPLKETDVRAQMARHLIDQAGGEQPETIAAEAADAALRKLVQKKAEYDRSKNGKH